MRIVVKASAAISLTVSYKYGEVEKCSDPLAGCREVKTTTTSTTTKTTTSTTTTSSTGKTYQCEDDEQQIASVVMGCQGNAGSMILEFEQNQKETLLAIPDAANNVFVEVTGPTKGFGLRLVDLNTESGIVGYKSPQTTDGLMEFYGMKISYSGSGTTRKRI